MSVPSGFKGVGSGVRGKTGKVGKQGTLATRGKTTAEPKHNAKDAK